MDSKKFDRLICEFPFLTKILADEHLSGESVEAIQVRRADRNLLEALPGGHHFDTCGWGDEYGFRHFWIVSPGEIIRLQDSFFKARAYEGGGCVKKAGLIGEQLVGFLDHKIGYIIEISKQWWDFEEMVQPTITIYKMKDFAWRRFVRPVANQV